MANEEHLEMIKRGTVVWNEWRKKYPEVTPDLSFTDLGGTELRGANLIRVNLSFANLSGADFSGADFSGAHLARVGFSDARLFLANFYGADLTRADFSDARLIDARFSRARLSRADLSGANLSGASLNGAELSFTNFVNADLRDVDLSGAIMWSTIFGNSDLRQAKGLETVDHTGPSTIGIDTLVRSEGNIPEVFLKGTGVPDSVIEYARSLIANPIEYYTCFISYSSKDKAFARRLHADLQSNNVRCWFAPEDMDIGDKIKHRIDESIRLYDKLLLVLSEYSITSTWVAYEVERALNKEPQGIPNVLYPVRLDDTILSCTQPWARDIQETRHIGDFERWKDHDTYQNSFRRLLRALKSRDKPRSE